jgi:hypothetical protein
VGLYWKWVNFGHLAFGMGRSKRMDNSHYLDIFLFFEEMPPVENKKGLGNPWPRHDQPGSQ